jgi:hypothetical protein
MSTENDHQEVTAAALPCFLVTTEKENERHCGSDVEAT